MGYRVNVTFATNFKRHTSAHAAQVEARCVCDALNATFEAQPNLRSYVLDDQGQVRPHITIFINDRTIADRNCQLDSLEDGDTIYVFQALSGG